MKIDWQALSLDMHSAWAGLRRRRGRSVLSALGIAIGVLALVAMLSISEGARREVQDKIANLGTNTIRVERVETGRASIVNISPGLTRADAEFLTSAMRGNVNLGYYVRRDDVQVGASEITARASVIGTTPQWLKIEGLSVFEGRILLTSDLDSRARVCLLGHSLMQSLRLTPGRVVRVGTVLCEVIGGLKPKGQLLTEGTGLASLDFDNAVVIPYSSFPNRPELSGVALIDGLVVRANAVNPEEELFAVAATLDGHLQRRHRDVVDYRIVVPLKLLQEAQRTQTLFQLVMGSIAGLSLLVGGIGVMNIMLANVSEQTREIGLRMAVGAPQWRIVSLYLWHSVLLCLVGSIVGMVAGMVVALAVQQIAGWPVAFAIESIVLGPLLALLSGVAFGLHPAVNAARLDPVAALHEL